MVAVVGAAARPLATEEQAVQVDLGVVAVAVVAQQKTQTRPALADEAVMVSVVFIHGEVSNALRNY